MANEHSNKLLILFCENILGVLIGFEKSWYYNDPNREEQFILTKETQVSLDTMTSWIH